MDIEVLVRLMQLQMANPTYENSQNRGSKELNFAFILAALTEGSKGGMDVPVPRLGTSLAKNIKNVHPMPENKEAPRVKKKEGFSGVKEVAVSKLEAMADQVAEKHGLNPVLLKAVVRAESDFNPRVVSRSGAMGLMQLMPETARSLGVKNPFDPMENLEGGARYLKSMIKRFDGDLKLALAAYNAGPGAVERYGGVPPYQETLSYVRKISGIMGGLNG